MSGGEGWNGHTLITGERSAWTGERESEGMVLISTVVGGLVLYVIFERYLKKALHRTQVEHKAIETGPLITAIVAAGLAPAAGPIH
jgi:hypothetical protein